jgi:hypothetical protein
MNKEKAISCLEKTYTFEQLKEIGVKPGDIVAWVGSCFEEGLSWDYATLSNKFPEEFAVTNCCYKDPRYLEMGMHPYDLGWYWVGSIRQIFRLPTEEEKKEYVQACINCLFKPIEYFDDGRVFGWGLKEYACLLHELHNYGHITMERARKINRGLKKIHGADLLKTYETGKIQYTGKKKV